MPKRTNDFQALMAYVYSQMAPQGAKVTESALLPERSSGVEREIDILVEQEIAGHIVRIGIECRDRTSKDDVTWIDGVIGKYADLDIHKVVVVSRSGFSQGAIQKANAHNIDACTLEEAAARNWPDEFLKLGFGMIIRTDSLKSVVFHSEPPLPDGLSLDVSVEKENGETVATLGQITMDCFNTSVRDGISRFLNTHFLTLFKVVADFRKALEVDAPVTFGEAYFIRISGIEHKLQGATFTAGSTFTFEDKPVDHYIYKKAMISIGMMDSDKGVQTINVVQLSGGKSEQTAQ